MRRAESPEPQSARDSRPHTQELTDSPKRRVANATDAPVDHAIDVPTSIVHLRAIMNKVRCSPTLRIQKLGPMTIVDFGDSDVPSDASVMMHFEQISQLVDESGCEVLGFDLTSVRFVPSGMLGLLVMLHNLGPEIHLYNASEEVRQAVEITHLDQLIKLQVLETNEERG